MRRSVIARVADDTVSRSPALGDLRFRNLLSTEEWNALPFAVRKRFSHRLAPGETVVYVGETVELRTNFAGCVLAQLARLIGAPLPRLANGCGPSVVAVSEDEATGGQMWTRLYARPGKFPQVIRSAKMFSGPTGLEEYVGCGVGMALNVRVRGEVLQFVSAGYFIRLGQRRMALPRWCTPGALTVSHAEAGDGRFTFTLDVVHPLFGAIIHQTAIFSEVSLSPIFLGGEGQGEGVVQRQSPSNSCSSGAAASPPHPNPLPLKKGEREKILPFSDCACQSAIFLEQTP